MLVTAIVPRLPPAIDGLGDYAYLLAHQLRQDFNIQTHFIVCDPNWNGAPILDGFSVSQLRQRSSENLHSYLNQQNTSVALFHYVGYGYAQRGAPIWLINGLQQWQRNTSATLITMFHEVYAAGTPPWTSAFWFFPLQKYLATRLAHLSSPILTSNQLYATILQFLAPQHQYITVLPIFSNVGEPTNPPPLISRPKQLVIFGGSASRNRVYQYAIPLLSQVCRSLQIDTIVDIGPKLSTIPSRVDHIPIKAMGELTATEISELLLQSIAGFLDYDPDCLAKSGVFAAYCAHGVLAINVKSSAEKIDGLTPSNHYLDVSSLSDHQLGNTEMQAISNAAHSWYQAHNLATHARTFAKLTYSCNR